ncbi:hypothetical protein NDU88_008085 [Pleurodeles waltl]|uniref:Uncharacterized protein n=1 Tax=Pleurodeles waltl TaxID=8319 RepID=A0AAV7SUN6_PLEWA|nr:hypothetical protein NDU88_008085 [Pleurodeles waltl]
MPRSGQTSPLIAGRAKERSRSRAGLKEGQDRPSGSEAHGRLSGCRAGTGRSAQLGPDDSSISDGTETLNEPRTQLVDYISNKVRDRSRDGRNDVPET